MNAEANIFANLDSLKLSPNYVAVVAQEVLTQVPLQRPGRQVFFRAHPDPNWSLTTSVLFDEDNFGRDAYLVVPHMRGELVGDARPVLLTSVMTRQGVFQFWPLKLPLDDGRPSPWYESARQALELSKEQWICVKPDIALGAYRVLQAIGQIPDPTWPDRPVNELLEIAFRGRVIDGANHPLVRRLRGAA